MLYIHEAIRKASIANGYIFRPQHPDWLLRPTNGKECVLVITKRHPDPRPRWQPKMEDLLADDWEVTTEGMT